MIGALKRWIRDTVDDGRAVPAVINHGSTPMVQVYKIENGYLVHKRSAGPYREDGILVYCPTPLDVARQIVNGEALAKMGIEQSLQTSGTATGSFVNKI